MVSVVEIPQESEVQNSDFEGTSQEVAEVEPAPPQFEEGGQATVDDLFKVNLGTEEDRRPTFISANMPAEEREVYMKTRISRFLPFHFPEMPGSPQAGSR